MNRSKFLDIKIDSCFKKVFGTEKNKDILISMLNHLIVFEDDVNITDVSFLKTSQDPDLAYKKQSIVDIMCQDQYGRQFIIELQVAERAGFEKRAQYYAAKAYSSQLGAGENYHELKQVIFLAFTNYIVFEGKQAFKSDHVILDKDTYARDLKDFSFTFVELPKFTKTFDELESALDYWCYFFKRSNQTTEQELEKIAQSYPSVGRAYQEVNQYNWSEEEYRGYERDLKNRRDWYAIEEAKQIRERKLQAALTEKTEKMQAALQKVEEASQKEQEALQKTKEAEAKAEQAEEKGIEKGKAEGREQERLDIARQLFATGMDIGQIQSITKLTISKLEQIQHLNTITPKDT